MQSPIVHAAERKLFKFTLEKLISPCAFYPWKHMEG